MKYTLAATLILLLPACATSEKYGEKLDSWVGHSESELVASWGPPDDVYIAPNGDRTLSYFGSRNMFIPGQAPSYRTTVVGNTAFTQAVGGRAATSIALTCRTSFTVANPKPKKTKPRPEFSNSGQMPGKSPQAQAGRIKTWSFKGNDCISY